MTTNWGTGGIDRFITPQHTTPYPAILPENLPLREGYTACIIGANGAIGTAIATSYASAGCTTLILASRRLDALATVAVACKSAPGAKANLRVEVIALDITIPEEFSGLVDVIDRCGGELDAVIVNSGYSGPVVTDIREDDLEMVKKVTEVCYLGSFYAAKYLLPFLTSGSSSTTAVQSGEKEEEKKHKEEGGARRGKGRKVFLTVGSHAGLIVRGPIANTQYCIAKLAQMKLVEHVHEQQQQQRTADNPLLAVSVHPGAVMTDMAIETAPEGFLRYCTDEPALCGGMCVWLSCGDEGGHATDAGEESKSKVWLGGRHVSAKWDVDSLMAMRAEIVSKDLLKTRLALF